MNYNRINCWYYINGNNKSPSWTRVEFLYNFLITNNGVGTKGRKSEINNLEVGDIIQLSFNGLTYSHTLVVVKPGTITQDTLIAAHTFDTFGKRVSDYSFDLYRCVHII